MQSLKHKGEMNYCMDELFELDVEPLIKAVEHFVVVRRVKTWGKRFEEFTKRIKAG
jgi:hypothetical protein